MTQSVKGCQLSKLTAKTFIFHAWADLWFYHWGGRGVAREGHRGTGGRSELQQKMLSGGSDVFFAFRLFNRIITHHIFVALCLVPM